ncbi:hypothetical protein OU787_25680 [Kitasatospora sp. YST-16]|uniref:hypothetical protein n=1 Tax=Kitasatospora sp. YST-16 TaxID=2998080 RepID=UPI00228379C6|nr:hypothetical protein [Kitasatospora sp. YST-16]WAL74587.1 hypothetical protein OU787_25680 [Kitasatospora sp. YST-16]WNW40645.1 hypothetical protein RKE32_25615 [Streptomyces sp. Li-HN-5-13]
MAMIPPPDAADFTFTLADALDIPVRVRSDGDLTKWHSRQAPKAVQPWSTAGTLPPDGEYLATTTWRQLVLAATSAGRDLAPWLGKTPALAVNELIARVAPLQAYLALEDVAAPAGAAGRRLFVNTVYRHGTERSAHAAFGYHLGMTMAQWLTVGMAGLPATVHLEACGIPELTDPTKKFPDLYGNHVVEALPWLIEAKAGKALGEPEMRKGQGQLNQASAKLAVPHRQVLCGTVLPKPHRWKDDHLVMMVHTALAAPSPDGSVYSLPDPPSGGDAPPLDETPDELLRATRANLLVFRALAFGAVQDLRVVPLANAAPDSAGHVRHDGRAQPLERDARTRELRAMVLDAGVPYEWVRAHEGDSVREFVVGRIPGIGLHLGLSLGMFAACARLHQVQAEVPAEEPLFPADPVLTGRGEDEEREAVSREARRTFYEREDERLETARRDMARAYATREVPTWLLRDAPTVVERPEARGGLLEARTAETYVAVESADPILSGRR